MEKKEVSFISTTKKEKNIASTDIIGVSKITDLPNTEPSLYKEDEYFTPAATSAPIVSSLKAQLRKDLWDKDPSGLAYFIVQENIQLEANPVEESGDWVTPPDVVRQPNCQPKPSKALPSGQIKEMDHTPPYMKGFESDAEFSEDLWVWSAQGVIRTENDNRQIQEEEKSEKNNNKSNPEHITKTYGEESAENPSTHDKKILSEAQKNYYQEFLARHPDWKFLDEERRNPEYQKEMKTLFAEVKEILKSKSRKSSFNCQDE